MMYVNVYLCNVYTNRYWGICILMGSKYCHSENVTNAKCVCVFVFVCVCLQVPTVHEVNHTMCPNGSAHLLTLYIMPDLFLLSAYLYGLFVIRVAMPEHLSTFVETVSIMYMCTWHIV